MPRYIDADELYGILSLLYDTEIVKEDKVARFIAEQTLFDVKEIPTADVQSVVHCKDCKHYTNNINPNFGMRKGYCDRITDYCFYKCKDNDFCSYGAKMDGAGNEN